MEDVEGIVTSDVAFKEDHPYLQLLLGHWEKLYMSVFDLHLNAVQQCYSAEGTISQAGNFRRLVVSVPDGGSSDEDDEESEQEYEEELVTVKAEAEGGEGEHQGNLNEANPSTNEAVATEKEVKFRRLRNVRLSIGKPTHMTKVGSDDEDNESVKSELSDLPELF